MRIAFHVNKYNISVCFWQQFETKKVMDLTKMKNANIRKYAEKALRNNKDRTTADTVQKVLKIAYWIISAAAIMTCLTMMIGNLVMMGEYKNAETADQLALYNEHRTYLITMIIAVFALVANFFLLHFKLSIPFAIVGCVDCIIVFTTFYGVSNANEFMTGPSKNFWVMAIPSIIVAAIAIALGVMMFINYRLRLPAMYDKIVDSIYRSYSKNGEVTLSAEQFEEILNNYKGEEMFPTDRPLSKSQRRRKEKQDRQRLEAAEHPSEEE